MNGGSDLQERLRLVVLTHPSPSAGPLLEVVEECLSSGCTAIQLRDKRATAAALYERAVELRRLTRRHGALLFVNDRLDVALAAKADGVHLGPEDVPIAAARRGAGGALLLGYSTDDPAEARRAEAAGADYLGVGAVFGTSSKAGLRDEAIGPARVGRIRAACHIPCVGIGGITPANAARVAEQGAGVAVLGAVMHADRPGDVVREILAQMARASRGVGPSPAGPV